MEAARPRCAASSPRETSTSAWIIKGSINISRRARQFVATWASVMFSQLSGLPNMNSCARVAGNDLLKSNYDQGNCRPRAGRRPRQGARRAVRPDAKRLVPQGRAWGLDPAEACTSTRFEFYGTALVGATTRITFVERGRHTLSNETRHRSRHRTGRMPPSTDPRHAAGATARCRRAWRNR